MRKGEAVGLRDLEGKALSSAPIPTAAISCPTRSRHANRPLRRRLADPRHCRRQAGFGRRLQEAVRDHRRRDRLGGRDRGPARRPTTPTLAELAVPDHGALRHAGGDPALLDDSAVNIDQWIAEEVRSAFAEQEGTAFVTGDGTNKPKGFLDYTKVADASWSWGNIGFIVTGVDGALRRRAIRPTS